MGAPFLGSIPLDPIVCLCSDQGRPLSEVDPEAQRPVTRAFQEIATHLIKQVDMAKTERAEGLDSFELAWKEIPS